MPHCGQGGSAAQGGKEGKEMGGGMGGAGLGGGGELARTSGGKGGGGGGLVGDSLETRTQPDLVQECAKLVITHALMVLYAAQQMWHNHTFCVCVCATSAVFVLVCVCHKCCVCHLCHICDCLTMLLCLCLFYNADQLLHCRDLVQMEGRSGHKLELRSEHCKS